MEVFLLQTEKSKPGKKAIHQSEGVNKCSNYLAYSDPPKLELVSAVCIFMGSQSEGERAGESTGLELVGLARKRLKQHNPGAVKSDWVVSGLELSVTACRHLLVCVNPS